MGPRMFTRHIVRTLPSLSFSQEHSSLAPTSTKAEDSSNERKTCIEVIGAKYIVLQHSATHPMHLAYSIAEALLMLLETNALIS